MDWLPIPIQELEPYIPSHRARRRQAQAWFSTIEMPPRLRPAADLSCEHLEWAHFDGVSWDEETTWPDKESLQNAQEIPSELKKQLGL